MTSDAPIRFKEHTAEQLAELLRPEGVDARLARRLQAAVLKLGGDAIPESMDEVSPRLLARLRERCEVPRLTLLERQVSPADGFAKYLFRSADDGVFEAVRIPLLHRPGDEKYVVCVSSQVGCAMGCVFCATGRLGFQRNLATWEIVDQVVQIRRDSEHPVRGVVFMGMGEPMLNYERVMRAADVFADPTGLGIAARAISVSTVGIVPMIRRFTREGRPQRLVVSLTAATHEKRARLLPVELTHPLPELMDAIREYHTATGERITLAWTLIEGVNDTEADAEALAELTKGLPIRLDLIEVNDITGAFHPPGEEGRRAFRDALTRHLAMPVVRRYSGGKDIQGACGMLAGTRLDVMRADETPLVPGEPGA